MSALISIFKTVGIIALVWIIIYLRIIAQRNALRKEILSTPDQLIIEPEIGEFRGSSNRFGMVKSIGVIALSRKNLIFCKPIGARITIPRSEIADLKHDTIFMNSYHSGKEHLIITLSDGTDVAFTVKDIGKWIKELSNRAADQSAV